MAASPSVAAPTLSPSAYESFLCHFTSSSSHLQRLQHRFANSSSELLSRSTSAVSLLNSKGMLLLLTLYLLRYPQFYRFARNSVIATAISCALVANFNLDLPTEARRRGVTVGLSRLTLAFICIYLFRRFERTVAPFYCALAVRTVPFAMFWFFRGMHQVLYRSLASFDTVGTGSSGPDTLALEHSFAEPKGLFPAPSATTVHNPVTPNNAPAGAVVAPPSPPAGVQPQCCICLEYDCDFRTSCTHSFHRSCLERWLQVRSRCPLCNSSLHDCLPLTRRLQAYFVLDYEEWCEAHTQLLCGRWWSSPVISTSASTGSRATAESAQQQRIETVRRLRSELTARQQQRMRESQPSTEDARQEDSDDEMQHDDDDDDSAENDDSWR